MDGGGATAIAAGSTVTITAGAGSPGGTQIFYSVSGAVPTPTTGTLYVGPFQLGFPSETVIAVAHDPLGCLLDAPPAVAVYTEAHD
jgi:hypothetical protein